MKHLRHQRLAMRLSGGPVSFGEQRTLPSQQPLVLLAELDFEDYLNIAEFIIPASNIC